MGGQLMDRFERRKERSKEDIRRAAEELFSQYGTDKISINDIAARAGVSQATVYNNFGSKEELVSDYRKTIVNKIAGKFQEILVWKKSWIEKFQGFLQSWIDIADRYRLETASRSSNRPASRDSINKEIENSFREFIQEGKKQKQVGADVSEEAMMAYIKFLQEGMANHPEIQNKMQHDVKLSQDLITLFIYGVHGKEEATRRK
jgi:AcrR family transcriptional regulator